MHVGNIFTSLVAWLSAKSRGGKIVLRIEDLDRERCRPEFAEAIKRDYEALGITWDNIDVVYQSQRTDAYEAAVDRLEQAGLVYPCFCSRADLHAASAPHKGDKPVYPGTCAYLLDEAKIVRARTRHPALRLRVNGQSIAFADGLQGPVEQYLPADCGDFIIKRSDGIFAYQLAVVVDDLFQGVDEIVRGYDLLDSTPQQIYLRRLITANEFRIIGHQQEWQDRDVTDQGLSREISALIDGVGDSISYLHVPLLVNEQGRRLSKRDEDMTLDGLLRTFGNIEAFIGYLAGTTGLTASFEPIAAEDLLTVFSLDRIKGVSSIVWRLP